MIFLTSLIYVLLLFVLPGELGLWSLSKMLGSGGQIQPVIILTAFNVIVYMGIYVALHFSKAAYEDFFQEEPGEEQRKRNRKLRDFLSVYGCQWLNVFGLTLIAVGVAVLLLRNALPMPFWFLFAAIIAALHDVMGKAEHVRWRKPLPKPGYLTPLPSDIPPDPSLPPPEPEGPTEQRTYIWNYSAPSASNRFEMELTLSENAYKKDGSVKRYKRDLENYPRYAKEGDKACVKAAALYLRRKTMENDFSAAAEVMNCAYFVRSIVYASDTKPDPYSGVLDYANFPIETLWEEKGDCEDHGILAAAVLRELGHDVALFYIELEDCGHIALAYCTEFAEGPYSVMHNGKKYAYVETVPTRLENRIGNISEQFFTEIKRAKILPID